MSLTCFIVSSIAIKKNILLSWNDGWHPFSLQSTPWLYYVIIIFLLNLIFTIAIYIYFSKYAATNAVSTLINILLFPSLYSGRYDLLVQLKTWNRGKI